MSRCLMRVLKLADCREQGIVENVQTLCGHRYLASPWEYELEVQLL